MGNIVGVTVVGVTGGKQKSQVSGHIALIIVPSPEESNIQLSHQNSTLIALLVMISQS